MLQIVFFCCNWMEGPQCLFATSSTLFFCLSLVPFTLILSFLSFSAYCSPHEWLGHLIQPPVPSPAGVKINRVVVWQRCCVLVAYRQQRVLPAAPDAQNHAVHTSASPLLPCSDCLQLPLKGWDFTDAQSAFLHGLHAENYAALLQFQHSPFKNCSSHSPPR